MSYFRAQLCTVLTKRVLMAHTPVSGNFDMCFIIEIMSVYGKDNGYWFLVCWFYHSLQTAVGIVIFILL